MFWLKCRNPEFTFRVKTKTVSGATEEESTFSLSEPTGMKASFKHGGHLRFGLARIFPRKLTLSADVILHAPVFYNLIELPLEQALQTQQAAHFNAIEGQPFSQSHIVSHNLAVVQIDLANLIVSRFGSEELAKLIVEYIA